MVTANFENMENIIKYYPINEIYKGQNYAVKLIKGNYTTSLIYIN